MFVYVKIKVKKDFYPKSSFKLLAFFCDMVGNPEHRRSRIASPFLLQADLYRDYPNAAGFTFSALHFLLPFGAYGTTNDLIIGKYITRATQFGEGKTHKNIYKPSYIKTGGAHNHHPEPVNGKLRCASILPYETYEVWQESS